MKVMIVDDCQTNRIKLRKHFEEMGVSVVAEASNGKEAIRVYSEARPDLVALDTAMPEMDGITTLCHLKALDPKAQVVIVTSTTTVASMLQAKEAGASHFLIKPLKKEKIAEVIQKFTRMPSEGPL